MDVLNDVVRTIFCCSFFRLSFGVKMTSNKLFVGGLTGETDEESLRKAFSRWSVRDGKYFKMIIK